MQYFRLLFGFSALLSTLACSPTYRSQISRYNVNASQLQPDYSNPYYWAAHPQKRDVADSIPAPLRNETKDSLADVFFLHPTTYTGNRTEWNADIHDAELNAKTDYTTILLQATAFNQHARVFAPRYRQVHLSTFYTKDASVLPAFDTAYADVKNAFENYLSQHHNGRPIIIASHSQGAFMAVRLLKEFFDGKPLQQKLVVAYIIGWPVFPSSFKNITVCSTPEQTGCACSWRTFKEGYKPEYVKEEKETAWVTNPLSWRADSTYIGREWNKGSVLRNLNQIFPGTTDARVRDGVLWANRPRFPWSFLYRTRNYHIGDINLYYINVRTNVDTRLRSYLGSK